MKQKEATLEADVYWLMLDQVLTFKLGIKLVETSYEQVPTS